LVKQKLLDRQIEYSLFKQRYTKRLSQIKTQQHEFNREMQRFISPEVFSKDFSDNLWWDNLLYLLKDWVKF
jgi:hypothetical protein